MKLALQIVDSLAGEWDPERYHDTYTEELRELIKRRKSGNGTTPEAPPPPTAEVLDLMAALEASVKDTKAKRSTNATRKALRDAAEDIEATDVDCEHHSEIPQGVHRGVPMIGDHLRRDEARELEPPVAVRRAHHGDLDGLIAQAGDAPCPLALDHASAFQLEAELNEELDRPFEVLDDDADVVQPERHLARVLSRAAPTAGSAAPGGRCAHRSRGDLTHCTDWQLDARSEVPPRTIRT